MINKKDFNVMRMNILKEHNNVKNKLVYKIVLKIQKKMKMSIKLNPSLTSYRVDLAEYREPGTPIDTFDLLASTFRSLGYDCNIYSNRGTQQQTHITIGW